MNEDALFDVLLGVATAEGSAQKGENYVYKNTDAQIVGVLRVLSTGVFIIAVRSDFRRRGVGTALLKAAEEREPIDFSKSTYSQDGQALLDAYLSATGAAVVGLPR
jgi:GNAT superfamily N-acetyltransferase